MGDTHIRDNKDPDNNYDYKIKIIFDDDLLEAGYTSVPNLLLNHYAKLGISVDELVFLLHLLQYKWTEKDPFPRLQTIAAKMGKGWRQAHRHAQSLKAKGFLKITNRVLQGRGQTTNEYNLSPLFIAVTTASKQANQAQNETALSNLTEGGRVKSDRGHLSKTTGVEENKNKKYTDLNNSNIRIPNTTSKNEETEANKHQIQGAPQQKPRYPEEKQIILEYIGDFAREFNDQAPLHSSVSRAYNLFERANSTVEAFIAILYEAKSITKERSSVIKATSIGDYLPAKNKMAYFFSIVEDLLGLRKEPHTSKKPDSLPSKAKPQQRGTRAPRTQIAPRP